MDMRRRKQNIVLFGLYCALMLWLLFYRPGQLAPLPYWEQVEANLNLIPFRTLRLFSGLLQDDRPHFVRAAVINLFGNVVMFIPLGLFLPLIFSNLRKLWKTLLWSALAVTAVEIAQLFTLVGSCDIDDLILNLLGAAMGYGLFRLKIRK